MVKLTWVLVALLVPPLSACNERSREQRGRAAKPQPKPQPRPAEKVYPCASHSDCVLSHRPDGKCCEVCAARAVHRDLLAATKSQDSGQCGVEPPPCPKLDCGMPKVKPVARCEEQRCVTQIVPARPPGDIDTLGRYKVTAPLPPRAPCRVDADCALTRARPGHCCLTECPSDRVAGTKAWVAAAEALRTQRCSQWLVQSSMGCDHPKCNPGGQPEARCDQGKCTVHFKPLR
jgi:hypothetical protein